MGDVGCAVAALLVAHGYFHTLETQRARAEEQIEIAEGIEVAEVAAAGLEVLVIDFPDHLGATERDFEALAQQPWEHGRKEPVGRSV